MDMKTKVPLGALIVALPIIGVWYLNDYKIAQADEKNAKQDAAIEAVDVATKEVRDRSLKNEQSMTEVKEDISAINQTMLEMQRVQHAQASIDMRQTTVLESIQKDLTELKRADRFGRQR